MSDLRELYQATILDHYKKPRNFGPLAEATTHVEGHNPLCGDRVTLHVLFDGDVVRDVRFEGSGCAISTASASMMTEAVKGRQRAEVERLFERFRDLIAGPEGSEADSDELGKLAVFSGVREYPTRVKCATLVWHALHSALGDATTVSTE
ncbi:MAG: SUF system NifU family Fe-S cluster assembly protein [Deltaproteobacteria bacterium]|nr:SUF system NifU family Fe-S cluster assembly protein [Deltaproteobacteria bacterium]